MGAQSFRLGEDLRALFAAEHGELEIAELLELNRAVDNKAEAVKEADAEEVRQEVMEALDERRLEITRALTHLGPFTEAAGSKRRRAHQRTQEEPIDEGQAEVG